MPKPLIFTRHKLEESNDELFQKYGDLAFYPNGLVKLGLASFSRHAPIHRHRFGANLVAIRPINSPNQLIIELPTGEQLIFLYRPFLRTWYQLVVLSDPWLYRNQQRFGLYPALGIYYFTNGVKGLLFGLVRALLDPPKR